MRNQPMNPRNFGKTFLVEECQRIQINDVLRKCRKNLKELFISSELETLGIKIDVTTSKTGYGGLRLWFKCPMCSKRVGVVFKHPLSQALGCRGCLGLDYKKRRYKGMVEASI